MISVKMNLVVKEIAKRLQYSFLGKYNNIIVQMSYGFLAKLS